MFRPTLNMKPYFCWNPWLHQCHPPIRNSTEVEEHWEPLVLAKYRRMVILHVVSRCNNRMFTQSTTTDYHEQQEESRANYAAWGNAREAARAFEDIKMSYASELSYALHYERLVRQEEETKRIQAEQLAKRAALWEKMRLQDEADNVSANAAMADLPVTLPEKIRVRIRYRIILALRNARWNRLPLANRRLLKGLPLIMAGVSA